MPKTIARDDVCCAHLPLKSMITGTPSRPKRARRRFSTKKPILARHQRAVVDLDGEARRRRAVLRRIVHLQPLAALLRHRPRGGHVGERPVQLARADVGSIASVESRDHVEQLRHADAGRGRHGQDGRLLAQLLRRCQRARLVEVGRREVALVERHHGRAAAPRRFAAMLTSSSLMPSVASATTMATWARSRLCRLRR